MLYCKRRVREGSDFALCAPSLDGRADHTKNTIVAHGEVEENITWIAKKIPRLRLANGHQKSS